MPKDNISVPEAIDKIRAILNIIVDDLNEGLREKIEDDNSSAGFLE